MIAGYRLLTNASFMLDSTARGKDYLGDILNRNLSFEADETDVFQFRQNLAEIRKSPNMQFGLSVGLNRTSVILDDVYEAIFDRTNAFTIYGLTEGELLTDFEEKLGLNFNLVFVKKIINTLELETALGYRLTNFSYFDQFASVTKETHVADFQLPIYVNYRIPVIFAGNTIGVQTGVNFSWLNSWTHSDRSGEKLNNNTSDVRSSFNYSWVIGAYYNWKLGNVILRPNFQYWIGLTPRSQQLTDSENAAFVYNDPSFTNYNARFNYFVFSLGILKQRF
jgi:hypothetical protein